MRVIDLLNKIANGEEIKAKLKFKLVDIIIDFYGMNNYYHEPKYNIAYINKGCTTPNFTLGTLIKSLNDEVEVIEDTPKEDKKIEKMEKPLASGYTSNYANKLCYKINEIIDRLNGDSDE